MAVTRVVAFEDGANNQRSIVTTRQRLYSDVDLSLTAKPGPGNGELGDIYKKFDVGAILQSIKNIMLTDEGEKPFQPEFGVGVAAQLFELNDPVTVNEIRQRIASNVQFYEPRVIVRDITINNRSDSLSLDVTLELAIRNTNEVVTFSTSLNRLR